MTRDGTLSLDAWASELADDDPMREYILNGVRDGFQILNPALIKNSVFVNNYKSAFNNLESVEQQIRCEIINNRYQIVSSPVKITSAIGAIPKKEPGKVRLIHDCSRPTGQALNDYALNNPFRFQSLQDAVKLISPNSFLAKVDLSNAYRSVKIHKSNYVGTGLHWTFTGDHHPTYMVDTRLPFGARLSPEIFHHLGQAVCRIMARRGYPSLIVYLDDFLVVGDSYDECRATMMELLGLLRRLGFAINYKKVEGPKQCLTFLGIQLDVSNMTLSLPVDRIRDLRDFLERTVALKKMTKRQLMSLAGKLNWATQVVYGGRFHLRRILNRIRDLRLPHHRSRITSEMRKDMLWWISFMTHFNGCTPMLDTRMTTSVCIDACPIAAGGYCDGNFVYTPWNNWPGAHNLHINYKETLALEPAVVQWAHTWANKTVYVHCDNQAAVSIINKGSSRDPFVMDSLRRVFWWSAIYNFRFKAVYIPGIYNQIADSVSRLHESNSVQRIAVLLQSLCLY